MRETNEMNPKEKGNREERKQARQLSLWMFGDKDVLKRPSDSGALEIIWSGDIVPMKQMPDEWNKRWPFMVEVKTGYKNHLPDFWAYGHLTKWVKKAYKESKTHNQNVVMLLTQFHRKTALISVNRCLSCLPYEVAYPVECEDIWLHMYVYRLKDLLAIPFKQVFNFEEIIHG
jgi:hypothetical protein